MKKSRFSETQIVSILNKADAGMAVWTAQPYPTTVPVFTSVKETPNRCLPVPLDCGTQVTPPSVVCRKI